MSKRVLIDIDGTVADWEQKFIDLMTEQHPHIQLLPHGTRTVADREREQEIRSHLETQQVLSSPGFYSTLSWYEGAKEAILKLEEEGHDVYFCSMPSRINPTSASEKLSWVSESLGDRWVDRVILTYRKDLVDADILIDDHLQPKSDRTRWEQVLYSQSYNQHLPHPLRFKNWNNYNELSEIIRRV